MAPRVQSKPKAETVGARLRRLRVAQGLSQEQLASAVGKSPSSLSLIESGKRVLMLADVPALAVALGVSRAYLAFGEDEPTTKEAT